MEPHKFHIDVTITAFAWSKEEADLRLVQYLTRGGYGCTTSSIHASKIDEVHPYDNRMRKTQALQPILNSTPNQ